MSATVEQLWAADVRRGYITAGGKRLPIVDNPCLRGAVAYLPDEGTRYEIAANSPERKEATRKANIRLTNATDPHHPAILFRARNNLTLAEAGAALGCSGMCVGMWERGVHKTPADIHERIEAWERENGGEE